MNKAQTVLLMGRAGSGKGTQAAFLRKHLGEKRTLYFYTGEYFRALVKHKGSLTAHLLEEKVLKLGNLAPSFLTIGAWTEALISALTADQHLILDGSPRTLLEARVLDEALLFYGRNDAKLVVIDITEEESLGRLLARARSDDTETVIHRRLKRYAENMPAVRDFLEREASALSFVTVDGVGSPEEVFERVKAALA